MTLITSLEPHIFAVHMYSRYPARKGGRTPTRFSVAFLQDTLHAPRDKQAKAKSLHAGRKYVVPELWWTWSRDKKTEGSGLLLINWSSWFLFCYHEQIQTKTKEHIYFSLQPLASYLSYQTLKFLFQVQRWKFNHDKDLFGLEVGWCMGAFGITGTRQS